MHKPDTELINDVPELYEIVRELSFKQELDKLSKMSWIIAMMLLPKPNWYSYLESFTSLFKHIENIVYQNVQTTYSVNTALITWKVPHLLQNYYEFLKKTIESINQSWVILSWIDSINQDLRNWTDRNATSTSFLSSLNHRKFQNPRVMNTYFIKSELSSFDLIKSFCQNEDLCDIVFNNEEIFKLQYEEEKKSTEENENTSNSSSILSS